MKITSSTIAMSAQTRTSEKYNKEESLKLWVGDKRPDFEGLSAFNRQEGIRIDSLTISEEAKHAGKVRKQAAGCVEGNDSIAFEISDRDKQKLLLIQRMLEKLTGKKIKFVIPERIKIDRPVIGRETSGEAFGAVRGREREGWGLEYDRSEYFYEHQSLEFNCAGVIRTADGREINIQAQLKLSREFASRTNISIRAGDAVMKDPLVINFNNTAPRLGGEKISFDIDCDGVADQVFFLDPGSGFLAIDLNGDGIVNNGGELFGPASGNGFAELALHDADGNNWIDENDPIYDKLRIWTRDEEGNHVLFALGQRGIGAIYLGSVYSAFDMKDSGNNLQGQIKRSGIFIREDGTAGTVQHIDLAV